MCLSAFVLLYNAAPTILPSGVLSAGRRAAGRAGEVNYARCVYSAVNILLLFFIDHASKHTSERHVSEKNIYRESARTKAG